MKLKMTIASAVAAAALAGCFTLKETPYPETQLTKLPEGKEMAVQLKGFAAHVAEYVSVYGYGPAYPDDHPYGRGGWGPGPCRPVPSVAYVPQMRESDVFMQRAKTLAESAGFVTMAQQPDYIVDVAFDGPVITDSERGVSAMWMLLSLLSADYSVQTWAAKLKIYDNKTGKLVFHHDYSQRYEVTIWGPLPILSPGGSSKNTYNAMQSWCLTALTDRVMADAAAFLVSKSR